MAAWLDDAYSRLLELRSQKATVGSYTDLTALSLEDDGSLLSSDGGSERPLVQPRDILQYYATSLSIRLAIDKAGATACASFSDISPITISESR